MAKTTTNESRNRCFLGKHSELEMVARDILSKHNIRSGQDSFALYKGAMDVFPEKNHFVVYDPEMFSFAIALASLYEKIINEEFTIERKYQVDICQSK